MTPLCHRPPRAVVATVLLAGALLVAGCSNSDSNATSTTVRNNHGDSVAVLGDSITTFDESDLHQQLGGDFTLVVSGNVGKTIDEVMPEAEVVAGRSYDQVIINLGTNDVLQGVAVAQSISGMQQMVALYTSAACIHLVNINEHMIDLQTDTSTTPAATALNAAVVEFTKSDQRLSIIDWNSVAASALNNKAPPYSTLTEDSIHPTQAGNARLNDLYRSALDSC